jgi:hypothetical protein
MLIPFRARVGEPLTRHARTSRDLGGRALFAASRRKGGALSADGAGSTHELNGPNFAHSILTTAELVAALP